MKRKRVIFIGTLLILQLFVLLYFGYQKQGMHFDEYYSYFTTNNSNGRGVTDRQWLSNEEMTRDFYVRDGETFHYGWVITLQSFDVHPPVFYLLLHTICSLMPGIYSMWQGLALNILYALLTTVFFYLISEKITKSQWAAFFISLISITNPGVISNVMFIRMYTLLTLWMVVAVWFHLCMGEKWHWKYFLLNGALAYVGFLTHYYYLIFLAFLEAAYWLPRLKKEWKRFAAYGACMLAAGILAVISYPACLGHMFAGYRGKQATGNLLNLTDIQARWNFFAGLMNQYVFHGTMLPVMLLAVGCLIFLLWKCRREMAPFIQCLFFPILGYFLVSLKASLYGEEAMLRYQMSIYGLILTGIGIVIYLFVKKIKEGRGWQKLAVTLCGCLAVVFLAFNIVGLAQKQVYFLYPEQAAMVEQAGEHAGDTVIYLYHKDEFKYLIWGDSQELWNFDKVYFVSTEDLSPLEDAEIRAANRLLVYSSTMGADQAFEEYADLIYRSNAHVTKYQKAYDGVYATAYVFD